MQGTPLSTGIGARERAAVALIVLGLTAALVYQAKRVGITVDEPAHVLSGYLFWLGQDNLEPRDLPPLIKLVGGWPARILRPPIPVDVPNVWRTQNEWIIAGEMLGKMEPAEVDRLFFACRLPLIVFPLLTAVIIWRWGRELFAPWIGVLLAAIYALEPTALSHGALYKNDAAAAFAYLWFWRRAWLLWRTPDHARVALLGVALGVALLAKISLLILLAIAPIAATAAFLPALRLKRAAVAIVCVLVVAYAVTVAGSGFKVIRLTEKTVADYETKGLLPSFALPVAQLFRYVPVSENVWNGMVSLLRSNRKDTGWVYAIGRLRDGGQPWYFALAVGVKTPIALQVLLLAGLIAAVIRWRHYVTTAIFWVAPGLLYFALASLSNLQLGFRLVLPALPFAILLCGPALIALRGRRAIILALGLCGWLALETARTYPHGIAYFNQWAGGPANGLRYLADSNLDWGQSLGEVARYCRGNGIPKINISYWGWDRPLRYFRPDEFETLMAPWEKSYVNGQVYQPAPGYYAISSQFLPGYVFAEDYHDYFQVFRERKPIAQAGYSIYIYRIEGTTAGSPSQP